jgi:hypothetical protein
VKWISFLLFGLIIFLQPVKAQIVHGDTVVSNQNNTISADTVIKERNSKYADSVRNRRIKKTILHSTFVPGWGQINNKQAWKTPIVAAAVTIPVILFFNNLTTYKDLKQAYIYKVDTFPANDVLIPPEYEPLSANSLKYYRDAYRQNVDYSALAFLLAWGLNIVDAAVFAHLKDFDVSDKLSMKFKPSIGPGGRGNLALIVTFRDANKRRPTFPNY